MESKVRYGLLDSIRGLVLISMIVYHSCWNLVYLFGVNWGWYRGTGAYIWQQSICWTFILLSGFCWSFGKKPLKRGLIVFGGGLLVSLATCLFMPQSRVLFGVLTLIGSCMLLMIPLDKLLKRVPPVIGGITAFLLFVLCRNVNEGWLGFEDWRFVKLPDLFYNGWLGTYLGFTEPGFFSTDYFSLIPWLFLFMTGYFLSRLCLERNGRSFLNRYFVKGIKPLSLPGKYSLLIYLLHQPVVYGVFLVFDELQFI